MDLKIRDQDALDYHELPRPGKVEVRPTKSCLTQRDLSLAYTPGVAVPCRAIARDPAAAYRYTNRGNLVAVISNGTAVLGLGNIGALAGKPVMEGKGVLFNRFAGIDVFDIEVATEDPEAFIQAVRVLAPTFGGINLEDIKAPECFEIEERLSELVDIPVFHDDQHGTAIIATAGLINALDLQDKQVEDVRVVIIGAGAAGVACGRMFAALGVDAEKILWVDSRGVIHLGREQGMNAHKQKLARKTDARTLEQALEGADVLVGVSGANLVDPRMLEAMAPRPIIFALANPDPEIGYQEAAAARPDAIIATGRSDFPNQVNNVLGFPFIFRGALDVRAGRINEAMKLAAARALADLARTDPPEVVLSAYGVDELSFGPEYILPKPLDPRVLLSVAPAVAEAAVESGVAGDTRWPGREAYALHLESLLGPSRRVMRLVLEKARRAPARIVFPEGEHLSVLRAAQRMVDEQICTPVLVGQPARIEAIAGEHGLDLAGCETLDPRSHEGLPELERRLYELRQRRGVSLSDAHRLLQDPLRIGLLLVEEEQASGLVGGLGRPYPSSVRPALEIIGPRDGVDHVTSVLAVILPDHLFLFADTAVNIDPDAATLAEMAILGAEAAEELFDLEPRVALLSFSNFGSVKDPRASKVARAVEMVAEARPDLVVDGEMQADVAVAPDAAELFPHSRIQGDANVLIFPDLGSGAIAYRLLSRLAGAETVGPILCGLSRPVNILTHHASVDEIVRAAAITVLQARRARC
ncbi:MAG TPA: NADP-dependent malic enzyme [Acidobacteria bacterium]|nr:NADP-dependent malic enzyme [Acidobacteriota bacterium]